MESNLGAKGLINKTCSKFIPCATSTPIRKPLQTLNNFMTLNAVEECNFLAPKGQRCPILLSNEEDDSVKLSEIQKKNMNLKRKRKEDVWSSSSSDEEDVNIEDLKQKKLVIKIGSSYKDGETAKEKSSLITSKKLLGTSIRTKTKDRLHTKENTYTLSFHNEKNSDTENVENYQSETRNVQLEIDKHFKIESNGQKKNEKTKQTKQTGVESKILNVIDYNENEKHNLELNECEKCKVLVAKSSKKSKEVLLQNRQPSSLCSSSINHLEIENDYNLIIQCKCKISKKKINDFTHLYKNSNDHDVANEIRWSQDDLSGVSSHIISSCGKDKQIENMKLLTISETKASFSSDLQVNKSLIDKCKNQESCLKIKTLVSTKRSKVKTDSCDEIKTDVCGQRMIRSKRIKKPPKEFWLPKAEISKATLSKGYVVNQEKDNKLQDKAISSLTECCKEEFQNRSSKLNKSDTSTHHCNDFVKNISQMEFIENSAGNGQEYFTAVAWQFPLFKCCILKIHKKSEVSGRTNSRKSHFGGIIWKGRVLMTIQGVETSLTSGQMFCVPPLTNWKAFNCGRIDCLVYYWCGRF